MLSKALADALDTALGRSHRDDPALPRTGGPAGNAALTAWLGLVLLALSVAELVTLLDVTGLISWHIVIGVLFVPPAVAKTVSTGWRIVRYYLGGPPYQHAGPPPLLLRVLGPLVVVSTLLLLATGLVLVFAGPSTTFAPLLTVLGQRISPLTLHQATFILWAPATGLHVLARMVPALQLTVLRQRPVRPAGTAARAVTLGAVVAASAVAAAMVLGSSRAWLNGDLHRFHRHEEDVRGAAVGGAVGH